MNKKKLIVVGGLGALIILNILWTVLQNRFTPKLEKVQEDLAKVEARLARIEKGGLADMVDLHEEFQELKSISSVYQESLKDLLNAEEAHLAELEAQTSAQKVRVETLRGQMPKAE